MEKMKDGQQQSGGCTPAGRNDGAGTGKGKVLIVDDEEMVRMIATNMLIRIGHKVAAVSDGAEAVSSCRQAKMEGHPFDLVVLDLTLGGGMDGVRTLKAIREITPGVRAVVITGYSNDPVVTNFEAFGFDAALAKPFQLQTLNEALAQAMGSGDGGH